MKEGKLRTKLPYPQKITPTGIGSDMSEDGGTDLTADYAPGVKAFYEDKARNEDLLLFFNYLPYTYRLSNGRTLAILVFSIADSDFEFVSDFGFKALFCVSTGGGI